MNTTLYPNIPCTLQVPFHTSYSVGIIFQARYKTLSACYKNNMQWFWVPNNIQWTLPNNFKPFQFYSKNILEY